MDVREIASQFGAARLYGQLTVVACNYKRVRLHGAGESGPRRSGPDERSDVMSRPERDCRVQHIEAHQSVPFVQVRDRGHANSQPPYGRKGTAPRGSFSGVGNGDNWEVAILVVVAMAATKLVKSP